MITSDAQRATFVAKVRTTPTGEITLVPGEADASLYGPVEIEWYPDRLLITALGAGPASITKASLSSEAQDVVVEIKLPGLDELPELIPGAD